MAYNEYDDNESYFNNLCIERINVLTEDFEITGDIYLPKSGRKRALTDLLNGTKKFMAIKNCEIKHRKLTPDYVEKQDFIQLNRDSIIILRLISENK